MHKWISIYVYEKFNRLFYLRLKHRIIYNLSFVLFVVVWPVRFKFIHD